MAGLGTEPASIDIIRLCNAYTPIDSQKHWANLDMKLLSSISIHSSAETSLYLKVDCLSAADVRKLVHVCLQLFKWIAREHIIYDILIN